MNWQRSLKGKVSLEEPLRKYTTFKIGGRAKFFIEPYNYEDLRLLLSLVKKYSIPLRVIGAGSNILIRDQGINGAVLRLSSPCFRKTSFHKNSVTVRAGKFLKELVLSIQKRGLSNTEFLIGIPGTVGGALAMNAGVKGKNIGDLVEDVTVMDYFGRIKTLKKENINFGYRKSSLSKFIILSAKLKLVKRNKRDIEEKIKRYLDYRRSSQDYSFASLGCVFKNPSGDSAGRLIDLCGLKGRRIGNACVSKKHANFILNLKKAKASDVLRLMRLVRKKVKDRFKINLEPEIKIW